jgi:hypothetical protein
MNKSDEPDQDKPRPKHSPSEEAMRVVEEYVNGLREIIKKLRASSHEALPGGLLKLPQERQWIDLNGFANRH